MPYETMLVVNVGVQGMRKTLRHIDGLEERIFEPNVVVRCSIEMGEYLLKKYCDPTMAIVFRLAEGEALSLPSLTPAATASPEPPDPNETDPHAVHAQAAATTTPPAVAPAPVQPTPRRGRGTRRGRR